ncbi:MAG TPA: NAD(P)-binding domain-containing protein [Vicinamibacterales bacterium]|nr:NAD(P)-binding domain-containing protein [Vicinamibacterales bacterium]
MSQLPQPRRFGVIGSGSVGRALASGLQKHGYDVRIGTRTPGKLAAFSAETGIAEGRFDEVAAWAEAVVLAVRGTAALDAIALAGHANLAGKPVLDTTNPLDAHHQTDDGVIRSFTGPNDSLMERLQAACPDAHFVKVFNSVNNAMMANAPLFKEGKATMFYCGNDAAAKAVTARLLDQFGWEGADMGRAAAARVIEPLCQLWCLQGILTGRWDHALKVLMP